MVKQLSDEDDTILIILLLAASSFAFIILLDSVAKNTFNYLVLHQILLVYFHLMISKAIICIFFVNFRHGMLSVAGKKADSLRLTRRLFTDTSVALAGKYSIMRKSLVIYDDHGPVARGERMACAL